MTPIMNIKITAKVKRRTIRVSGGNTTRACLTAMPAPAQMSIAQTIAIYGMSFFNEQNSVKKCNY
jgi:hypothetical protein